MNHSKNFQHSRVVALMDEHQVDLMLYDPRQDRHWIQFFRENIGWEIVSEDQDAVLFVRKDFQPSE